MGTCCLTHLTTMVMEYAPDAQNGAVTIRIIENPIQTGVEAPTGPLYCNYCNARAAFMVSYFKKTK